MSKALVTQVTKGVSKITPTLEKHVIIATNKIMSLVNVRRKSLQIKIEIGIKGLSRATEATKMVVTLNITLIKEILTVTVIITADAIIATA